MSRHAAFVLFLSFGVVFQLTRGTEVNVTDTDKKLCLYANLKVDFSVSYNATGGLSVAHFVLPKNVTTDGSSCQNTSSTLKLNFGEGHSWTVTFTLKENQYEADSISFSYNLSDTTRFINSTSNETLSVTVEPQITGVGMDTCYSCKSKDLIQASLVNMTLSDVLIQAFIVNGSRSENVTTCRADSPTTAPPTTHVTNATSAPPTPTPTPTPTLPTPSTGKYSIKPDTNSTACLLATFGLRIGFTREGKYQEMNLDPNGTVVSGSCESNSSELVLTSKDMTVIFTFTSDTKKFRLHALNVTTRGVPFSEVSTNLSLWEAAVGSSYMCNKEQNNSVSSLLSLYTFSLQVQPFEVKKGVFSTAHECSLDDTSILIPIIVGAVLAGLILVVVVAYVIGRRKTYAGYQTL